MTLARVYRSNSEAAAKFLKGAEKAYEDMVKNGDINPDVQKFLLEELRMEGSKIQAATIDLNPAAESSKEPDRHGILSGAFV